MTGRDMSPGLPEVWAGVECTVNRIGDRFHDQLCRSGHADRLDDLDRIAGLGVRRVRYPVLWERVAPDGVHRARWEWSDERLARLRALGIDPIVGLLHHGSGPRGTSLVDACFPEALAGFARAVAERYPWVTHYTPINEPLTTARFSALYGHWYPHLCDDRAFVRALMNQVRGTALAMREIRRVNADARLVQTEDLGHTHATPMLRYQAEFENARRWLTFDLLAGRVGRAHPLWRYLRARGATERELDALRDEPCPPDIVGVNHYLTSERFLDQRTGRYPAWSHGGNGRHRYADVEALRVCDRVEGPRRLLAAAWERYRLPIAVTEVHVGATREQQLRWLHEVWTAACALRATGADVRAVTAWALFGAFDWHVLLTRELGHYEPGPFDVEGPSPRATALAEMVGQLARGESPAHPVLAGRGWWQHECRLAYPVVRVTRGRRRDDTDEADPRPASDAPPILVTGGSGTLGAAFARVCAERDIAVHLTTRRELDIADPESVVEVLDRVQPWAVVNAAGFVRVDDAERDGDRCLRENRDGAVILADACQRRGLALATFSSDLVFDGGQRRPYVERDRTRPLCLYGVSKAEAERAVLERCRTALVVRTSAFFGPWDEANFVECALRALDSSLSFDAAEDEVVSPTYVPDLVHATLDLLIDRAHGIWHLANDGAVTWAELAREAATRAGLEHALVRARPGRLLGRVAPRPPYSALSTERGVRLPSLDDALARFLTARAARTSILQGVQ
jgi:dTDP-4-dehydrorhamnose reductase